MIGSAHFRRTSRIAAFTGARDPLVAPAHIAAFQSEMMQAQADWQMSVYGRALHSFTNVAVDGLGDLRMAYDREADEASWSAMLRFFDASFDQRLRQSRVCYPSTP